MLRRRTWVEVMLTLVGLAALAVVGQGALSGTAWALAPSPTPSFREVCQHVLTRAVSLTEQNCGETGRNEACYGFNRVQVEWQEALDPASVRFEESGDIVPIRNLARIQTHGLNPDTGDWGLALVKLQANLPNTNPGQNVTFILYGNTSLSQDEDQTNAFYLSTELGSLTCNRLPSSSLIVRAPANVAVNFTLNDVQIRLASTLVLSAAQTSLQVKVMEGHASVTAGHVTQAMVAGQELAVPLDPVTGNAAGAPSEPVAFAHEPVMDSMGALADTVSGEALEGGITLDGPIEMIDREGGWITVNGRRIKVDPAILAGLEVGQIFRFSGYGYGFITFELPPGVAVPPGGRLPPDVLAQILRDRGLGMPTEEAPAPPTLAPPTAARQPSNTPLPPAPTVEPPTPAPPTLTPVLPTLTPVPPTVTPAPPTPAPPTDPPPTDPPPPPTDAPPPTRRPMPTQCRGRDCPGG
ncbi:MAG: hypothetical protein IT323_21720 [Anaerolineae bacterium]|nr:hypothetical protein [Anaerolineae bacterium]